VPRGPAVRLDRVPATLQARRLGAHVVRALVRRGCAAGGGVIAGLAGRPLMALELVLPLLIRALTVLGIGDEVRSRRRAARAALHLRGEAVRRGNRLVLPRVRVIDVVRVIGVVVGNAAPVIRLVVERQAREVQPETKAAPAPTPAAAPPTPTAAPAAPAAVVPAVPTGIAVAAVIVAAIRSRVPAGDGMAACAAKVAAARMTAARVLREGAG
jgi:hypothetical protein